ncbi:MAG: hypothetical protein LLG13_09535 [Bacteroidales bacterium]|nr:hypothetical protein [Bacteroidales bacterium]
MKYFIIVPEIADKIEEEWAQCLKQIINFRVAGYQLIKMNVFTDLPDYETFIRVNRKIGETIIDALGDECPVFNVTAHPPEPPWKVTIEAGYLKVDSSEIIRKKWNTIPYVVRVSHLGKELWAGGMGTGFFPYDTRKAAGEAFCQMKGILDAEQMSFDHLVRQWNYIGNILEVKNGVQNYQIFNKVRGEYYQKYRSIQSYPAATGVGMKHGGVQLDFYGIKPEQSVKLFPVDNPDQIKPYSYGQQVLKGIQDGGQRKKQPPQFERAVLLVDKLIATLYVSGTASIIGQDTIGIEDIDNQTSVTIENVGKLYDLNRLNRLMGNSETSTGKLSMLRVYIKDQDYFVKVKQICEECFPGVPVSYIETDLCRDNLLVEMEAEFSIDILK